MAMSRRNPESWWPQPFEGFDWALRPLGAWRRMMEEDQVKVDEFTEGDQLVVRAELPGVDPDRDVDISIVDGNLHIRAERRQEQKVEDRNYRRSEIRYGSFSRVLPLPSGTKEDDIKASYRDGMLEVRAPVQGGSRQPSRIPIERSSSG